MEIILFVYNTKIGAVLNGYSDCYRSVLMIGIKLKSSFFLERLLFFVKNVLR